MVDILAVPTSNSASDLTGAVRFYDLALPVTLSVSSTDLIADVEYQFVVIGDEAPSGVATITTSVPSQFTPGIWSVIDLASGGGIRISISSVPANNGATISDIEYSTDGASWTSVGGAIAGDYDLTGFAVDAALSVQIRAVNAEGAGQASASKSVTPTAQAVVPDALDPATDFTVSGNGTSGEVTLTLINLPADNGSALTLIEYQIYDAASGVEVAWTDFGSLATGAITLTGLPDDEDLELVMRATNANGVSADSDAYEFVISAAPIIVNDGATVGDVIVNQVDGTIDVELSQPQSVVGVYQIDTTALASGPVHLATAFSGGDAAGDVKTVAHSIWASDDADGLPSQTFAWRSGGVEVGTGDSFTVTANEVSNGLQLRITSTNGAGSIVIDLTAIALTLDVPGQIGPSDWDVVDQNNSDSALVSILTLPAANGSAITDIEYRVDGGAWSSLGLATMGNVSVGGFAEGSYVMDLRAVNGEGDGAASAGKPFDITDAGSYTENGVYFDRSTYFSLGQDLVADNGNLLNFVSASDIRSQRAAILSWLASTNGQLRGWDGTTGALLQARLQADGGGASTYASSDFAVDGDGLTGRIAGLTSVAPEGSDLRVRLATLAEGGTWTVEIDELIAGRSVLNLASGLVTLGSYHDGSNKFEGNLYRLALWSGSGFTPPDITQASVQAKFMVNATNTQDPAVSRADYGTPLIDFSGSATRWNSGLHDGSLPAFTLVQGGLTNAT